LHKFLITDYDFPDVDLELALFRDAVLRARHRRNAARGRPDRGRARLQGCSRSTRR
jgi:hypothetical protein